MLSFIAIFEESYLQQPPAKTAGASKVVIICFELQRDGGAACNVFFPQTQATGLVNDDHFCFGARYEAARRAIEGFLGFSYNGVRKTLFKVI